MAYYGIITGMDLADAETLTVRYELRDDASGGMGAVFSQHVTLPWILRDGEGMVISETLAERTARLQGAFHAVVDASIAEMESLEGQFAALRARATGYRYPAAS